MQKKNGLILTLSRHLISYGELSCGPWCILMVWMENEWNTCILKIADSDANENFHATPAHIVFGETGHFPLYSLIYCGFISDCTNLLPCPRKTKICIEQIFIPPILWWKCVLNSWLDCIQKLFDSCVRQTQGFNVNIKWITKSGDRNNSSTESLSNYLKTLSRS